MEKEQLKKLIATAGGRRKADLVIKNCKIVDVFAGKIIDGDIAVSDGQIAGIGEYNGEKIVDAQGRYALPGLIDSHIHIESSYVSPEELGRLVVPHGTGTIIADPHEIVNVCGIQGLDYMMAAAENTALDIKFMLPSCVPATPFEHAGDTIDAKKMEEPITRENILGLGEFMNYPGIINLDDDSMDKLMVAKRAGKLIDGHSPGVKGYDLAAYASARIQGDHECATVEDMEERISLGMYVLLRQGSACHDLRKLVKGVTVENSRRCLLCSDDRQPKTISEEGHIDNHLRMCVEEGLDPITAIRMATLNAAECFRLYDRGAIAPGYRADVVLVDDLTAFRVNKVWLNGKLVAEDGKYLLEFRRQSIDAVQSSVHLKDFSKEKFRVALKSNRVHTVEILPGGVVTKKSVDTVKLDQNGEFVFDPEKDIVKMAVVERHKMTGNVACGFLKGYGIKRGAVALSVAHDSHNIIVTGVNDDEMEFAVRELEKMGGGIILVNDCKVVESMPMPIAGLMSDRSGEWVDEKLTALHEKAYSALGISGSVEPLMTLCFMSLPVIPEVKLTDIGLFDVTSFSFIPLEADEE